MLHGGAGTITGSPIQKYWDRNWKIKVLLSLLVAFFLIISLHACFPVSKTSSRADEVKAEQVVSLSGVNLAKKK